MVAMATPMHADGSLDEDSLTRLVEFHIENDTDAIVAVGTTGESATLDIPEHSYVIKRVVDLVAGRIPVIGGTGANATSEAIELTQNAKDAGVDACLLVTPYYNKPTQEGLYLHFKAVAEAVAIDQILYNVPGRTAVDMLPDTVARLAAVDNIIGVKEATGSVERASEIIARCDDNFGVYSGEDHSAMEVILAGGHGVISVTANVAPRLMHDMCNAALAADRSAATEINDLLIPLHRELFCESNPIPAKWALQQMGLIEQGIRLPLTWLSEPMHEQVRAALRTAGVL
jgi:4-hydroxy-tetrahydrodipicolinate synthase